MEHPIFIVFLFCSLCMRHGSSLSTMSSTQHPQLCSWPSLNRCEILRFFLWIQWSSFLDLILRHSHQFIFTTRYLSFQSQRCVIGCECRKQPEVAGAVQTWTETGALQPSHAVLNTPSCSLHITCSLLHPIWSLLQHSLWLPDNGGHCRNGSNVHSQHWGQDCTL